MSDEQLTKIMYVVVALLVYFLPSILGKKHKNFSSIFIIDFLGWTLIRWVVALAWAVKKFVIALGSLRISPESISNPFTIPSCKSDSEKLPYYIRFRMLILKKVIFTISHLY